MKVDGVTRAGSTGVVLGLFAAVLLVALAAPSPAGASSPCRGSGSRGFLCTTVTVPLDREAVRSGMLRLPVAYQPARAGHRSLLLALSGGPGQSSISAAASFRAALAPALRRSRLVVFDQRGTGAAALNCPELQTLGNIDGVPGSAVSACARRLGSRLADYGTADTVGDIEAIRRRFAAPKLTIMGVSYGTYVAEQYARKYPNRVSGLILDSPVGIDGLDAFLLDSLKPLKRIIEGWCTSIGCPASVGRPWNNLAVTAAAVRDGGLSARLPDARGHVRTKRLKDEGVLESLIGSTDVNPALQALLPGALAAAAAGDGAQLLRLMGAADGPPVRRQDLSAGLNVATICADTALPFSYADNLATRRSKMIAAISAVPAESYAPFSRDTVLSGSIAADCSVWAATTGAAQPSMRALPDVPALVLSGGFDQRTPTEGARTLAALMPRSHLVTVGGTGHDTIDTDASGCVARALGRFAVGTKIGQPCSGVDNRWRVAERPARSLKSVTPVSGGARLGDRRVLAAVIATVHDAHLQAYAQLFSGVAMPRGGGLRGGRFSAGDVVVLRGYELVRGVRVTNSARSPGGVRVRLPAGQSARLTLSPDGTVRGTISGRPVRTRAAVLADLAARP